MEIGSPRQRFFLRAFYPITGTYLSERALSGACSQTER